MSSHVSNSSVIPLTGDLDPRLYLSNRNGRHEELLRRHTSGQVVVNNLQCR